MYLDHCMYAIYVCIVLYGYYTVSMQGHMLKQGPYIMQGGSGISPPPPKNLLIENYVKIALINRRYNDSGFASDEDLGAVS